MTETAIFTKRVSDYMGTAPLKAVSGEALGDLVQRMRRAGATSVIVQSDQGLPVGIITEQDICRRVAFLAEPDTVVERAMSTPVKTIRAGDLLYRGIVEMRRGKLRHLPVIDESGQPVGILQLHDALAAATEPVLVQIEALTHSETLGGMLRTKAAQANVAESLLRDNVPATEIQQLLTDINNDLYRRVVDVNIHEMVSEGWGEPPAAFDVIVMGSGGRGESYLYPDQDNGFVIEDYPDEQHTRIDSWFLELATRMTDSLNRIGFPYCNGYVMATNPLWRKTISQWRAQVSRWVGQSRDQTLRLADIFFDFKSVYGAGNLTAALSLHVTGMAKRRFFLREMFKFDEEHDVALGPFNRLLTDRLTAKGENKINLKFTGTLPLVGAIRIAALAYGIESRSTLARIAALHAAKVLNDDEQDYLSGAYRHIVRLLLREQLRDFANGNDVGSYVALNAITEREKHILIDSFKAIKKFRRRLRTELTGDIF